MLHDPLTDDSLGAPMQAADESNDAMLTSTYCITQDAASSLLWDNRRIRAPSCRCQRELDDPKDYMEAVSPLIIPP